MIQRIVIFLACLTVGVICLVKLTPIVIEKEIHRQDVACQSMKDRGYPVECH